MTDSAWIRELSPEAPDLPLVVCLPHAGGAVSFYRPMGELLGDVTEVWAVQYPGRQDRFREQQCSTMAELADEVADELSRHAAGRAITLFGHSMGALLGFEVARRLQQQEVSPIRRLIASGRGAPSFGLAGRVASADDETIVGELLRMDGTDPIALQDPELLELALPAIRADYAILESYRAAEEATVSCPVTAVYGDADPLAPQEEVARWRQHVDGGEFTFHTFEGGHFYLVKHVQGVADIVRNCVSS